MPWVGFEPTISASEWAKTFHALNRAATVIGSLNITIIIIIIVDMRGLKIIYSVQLPGCNFLAFHLQLHRANYRFGGARC
jgi:hypothetical protein